MTRLKLDPFGQGIWTVSAPLKLAGAEFGTRMTVVRIGEAGLALIAPCPIDSTLESELRALGHVEAVIAPNCFHYAYFTDALRLFPEAVPFVAEGVDAKLGGRPPNARLLDRTPDVIWSSDLEQCLIPGAPKLNETIFFHAASRALVLTDFCFNFDPAPGGWTGFFLRLAGAHGKLSSSRLMRSLLKDRVELRAVLERILAWDFDRIVVTHGENISANAKALFRQATADL